MRLALLLLAAVAACSDGPFGLPSDLSTAVSLSSGLASPGDSITVQLSLTNPTADPIRILGSSSCFLTFTVRAQDGTDLTADPRICATIVATVTLQPGERRETSIRWGLAANGAPLPLGLYMVRAGLALANEHALQAQSLPTTLRLVASGT